MAWTILADKNRLVITGKAVEDDRINLALSFEKNQKGRFDVNFKLDLLGVDSDFSETIKGLDLEITSDTFDTIREMQHSGIR